MTHDGRDPIEREGFRYLPRFLTSDEADALVDYFAALHPIWERRYADDARGREGARGRRLTRPVYWLGAWQFASLGYYAPPKHTEDKCLRAEPFPEVMSAALARLGPRERPFTSALINYYGDRLTDGPPVDLARLRAHRDHEPGPVVMLSVGQPARFEFLDPDDPTHPHLSVWLRHRSAVVFDGPLFKDKLYHHVVEVRRGLDPKLSTTLDAFRLRRVSVSFRHVPEAHIHELADLGDEAREIVRPYVEELAEHSPHFAAQLKRAES